MSTVKSKLAENGIYLENGSLKINDVQSKLNRIEHLRGYLNKLKLIVDIFPMSEIEKEKLRMTYKDITKEIKRLR